MTDRFYFGVDYYPEHWPQDQWERDARMMKDAGINLVRIAEFAWSKIEPRGGQFQFDWLDQAIQVLGNQGISIVLGTPTASPPPWLMVSHPEIFLVREDGTAVTYGNRRNYCPTNLHYRQNAQRIVRTMAERYCQESNVIGWQIDNEFGDRCYCPRCQNAFQAWLKEHFETFDAINERWGTAFWSHGYSDWPQIPLPWTTSDAPNPGLALDYYRFMSEAYVYFQHEQIEILRDICPDSFITHNFMGFGYKNINYFNLAEDLDFVSWDNYPRGFWSGTTVDVPGTALGHDTMRGLKGQNYWVMEAQSGISGWGTMGMAPRPGEIRLWAYQGIAHGADAIVFFRWRTARHGTEQYWHGVLDHDGRPRRRYEEVRKMGKEIALIGTNIFGAQTHADVAILAPYDTRFALEIQPHRDDFDYAAHLGMYYKALHDRNISVDIVNASADFSHYKVVIAPALYVVDQPLADRLSAFAQAGGVVVFTARSGVKDADNAIVNMPLPGRLAELCGVQVAEYDVAPGQFTNPLAFHPKLEGAKGAASIWYDVLEPTTAEPIAMYTRNYYAKKPAVTVNDAGQGKAIYVGTLGDADLADTLVGFALDLAQVDMPLQTPPGVEAVVRWQGDRRLLFLLNHSARPQEVALDDEYMDLLNRDHVTGVVRLGVKDVLVLAQD